MARQEIDYNTFKVETADKREELAKTMQAVNSQVEGFIINNFTLFQTSFYSYSEIQKKQLNE